MVNGPLTREQISCGHVLFIAPKIAMDCLTSFPALDGLVQLGNRDNIDISPTLLRVLTDLYVSKPRHTADEERQYTELVLRLIAVVDVSARHRLAQRLASYGAAPAPVLRRLACDVIAVAEPILRQSRVLSTAELRAIAQQAGSGHMAALAARGDLEPQPQDAILPIADLFAGSRAAAQELNELFLVVDSAERRLILLHLDYALFAPAKPYDAQIAHEAARRIELAALSRNFESFLRELARALSISVGQARRIANDAGGEPIIVAAKALSMPTDVLQRVLLCLNPAISQSVQRVYELADLYEALKPEAAMRMLAIWQAISHGRVPDAHQPHYSAEKTRVRADAAALQRRAAGPKAPDQRTGTRRN
jgi:uncharacterized protein (DUF2336 family)